MSGHTPGPWEADRATDLETAGLYYHQIDAVIGPEEEAFRRTRGIGYPKTVTHTGDRDPDIGSEEDAANALLMAAAPELADALEGLNRDERIIGWIPIIWNAETQRQEALSLVHCDEARVALRKAGRLS